MNEWEYKITSTPRLTEIELNRYGAYGWEVVAVVAVAHASYYVVMKRKKAIQDEKTDM